MKVFGHDIACELLGFVDAERFSVRHKGGNLTAPRFLFHLSQHLKELARKGRRPSSWLARLHGFEFRRHGWNVGQQVFCFPIEFSLEIPGGGRRGGGRLLSCVVVIVGVEVIAVAGHCRSRVGKAERVARCRVGELL